MRLRNIRGAGEKIESSEFVVQNPKEMPNKWKECFGNDHPIHIEIGMGKGQFLHTMAKLNPEINYVGIEMYSSVLLRAIQKMEQDVVPNLKFICIDAKEVAEVFGNGEVDQIYLNFSDPWPKARHAKRRLTYKTFLDKYYSLLKKGGKIIMKTDNLGLFEYSLESIKEHNKFKLVEYTFDYEFDGSKDGMSEYERKFREIGTKINRLVCIKE